MPPEEALVRERFGEVPRCIEHHLDNAFDFTPRKGQVTVELAAEERALVLKVSDTGAGISEKNLARIFERFYTTERPATGQKGTGLGLSIALNIVKAHGGRIDARSEPGRGTQFTVVLPRAFDEDR